MDSTPIPIAVLNCPCCERAESCSAELDDLVALGTRLQEHLVSDHGWAYTAAVDAATAWFLGALRAAEGARGITQPAGPSRANR